MDKVRKSIHSVDFDFVSRKWIEYLNLYLLSATFIYKTEVNIWTFGDTRHMVELREKQPLNRDNFFFLAENDMLLSSSGLARR
jgi:hypothetical protein